jgi:hypothetical protein
MHPPNTLLVIPIEVVYCPQAQPRTAVISRGSAEMLRILPLRDALHETALN